MELLMVGVFLISSIVGYLIIRKVPSLLHTPLMSGMNALSGVTVLGALVATATSSKPIVQIFSGLAVVLAFTNVVGGFSVTHRMLKMFVHKRGEEDK